MDLSAQIWEVAPKTAHYIGLSLAIGTVVARRLLAGIPGTWSATGSAISMLQRLALAAAAVVLAASALRAAGHSVAAFGAAGLAADSLRIIIVDSRWGEAWRWQAAAALLLLTSALTVRAQRGRGWMLMGAGVLACAATTPLLGHAAGSASRSMVHAAHLLAGGAWLGTLIALVALEPLLRGEPGGVPGGMAPLVARFSPLALSAAAVVLASGLTVVLAYLPSPADLLATPYGRVLAVKLGLVAGILGCGFGNWRRARLGVTPGAALMRTEAALALVTLVVSSLLTETEQP